MIAILAGAPLAASSAAHAQQPKSLYDRLGGVYPISVVDSFIDLRSHPVARVQSLLRFSAKIRG